MNEHCITIERLSIPISSSPRSTSAAAAAAAASSSSPGSKAVHVRLPCKWAVKELKFQRNWPLIIHERDDILFFAQLAKGADGLFYVWLQSLGERGFFC